MHEVHFEVFPNGKYLEKKTSYIRGKTIIDSLRMLFLMSIQVQIRMTMSNRLLTYENYFRWKLSFWCEKIDFSDKYFVATPYNGLQLSKKSATHH